MPTWMFRTKDAELIAAVRADASAQQKDEPKKDQGGTGLTEGASVSVSVPTPQLPHVAEALEAQRMLAVFQEMARDESISDRAVRAAVKWVAGDQRLTEAEIQHGRELAAKHGWETDQARSAQSGVVTSDLRAAHRGNIKDEK